MRFTAPLAFTLALASPALARAQQPAAPPTGEPPPPEARAAEQAAITNQARQAYAQAHQDELRHEAARQVDQERRAAWNQRGLDSVPPPFVTYPPGLSASVMGGFGGWKDALNLTVSGALDLRVGRWWGLAAGGGVASFRSLDDASPSSTRLSAGVAEVSSYLAILSNAKHYTESSYGLLRIGNQLLFPIQRPNLPSAYLGFFAGFGGVFALAQLASGKGYAGFALDMRIGYRFGLQPGEDTPFQGVYYDLLAGPAVGF